MNKIYIWERVVEMSKRYHSEGGVVIIADSLERAREIGKKHYDPGEESYEKRYEHSTIFNTEPNKVYEVSADEEYYCDFPDAGCC